MIGTSAICGFVTQTTNKMNVVRAASVKIYHTQRRSISSKIFARNSHAGYTKAVSSLVVNQTKSLLANYPLVVSMR